MAYLTSTPPRRYKLLLYRAFHALLGPWARFFLRRKFSSLSVSGTEHLRGGPKLVVMNHSCPLDPVLITFFGCQPLQFLITEPFMQGSFASKIAACFGQITKRKLDFDAGSIQLMKRWSDCGAHVALFPEGQFSWDGGPSPLMAGLPQLIKYLDLPVVCVHLANGDRVKPAWARKMRRTGVMITIHPPIAHAGEGDIMAAIKERIFPARTAPVIFPAEGRDLALGLTRIVRFCPKCGEDGSLRDGGNFLSCRSCGGSWEIGADNGIKGPSFTSVGQLFGHLRRFVEQEWRKSPSLSSLDDVVLFDATKKDWVFVSKGRMTVTPQGIDVGQFRLDAGDIVDHALDWGDVIIVKTRKRRYTLKFGADSRLIFAHLFKEIPHA